MKNLKGYIFAALAAAAYGTNPAFAIPLYSEGMNPNSVLLFRYLLGIPLLIVLMWVRGINFSITKSEILPVMILGILMGLSSLTLFESYCYMNSGIASTLLFVYPIMVAVIMICFFNEKFKGSLVACLFFMCLGLWMLMKPEASGAFSWIGFLLVMISALTYAVYIVYVNVSETLSKIPTTKLLFYVLVFGSLVFVFKIFMGTEFTLPTNIGWLNLIALAVIPTIISLAFTSMAIHIIGSTPTAILGALEPVTAVILSVIILNQSITIQEVTGGVLIILAATIVVANKTVDRFILHVRKMFPRHLLKK